MATVKVIIVFQKTNKYYWLQQPLWDNVLLIYVHCSSLLVFTLLAERNEESGWIVLVKQSDAFRWHQRSHRGPSPTGITFTLFWHLSLSPISQLSGFRFGALSANYTRLRPDCHFPPVNGRVWTESILSDLYKALGLLGGSILLGLQV